MHSNNFGQSIDHIDDLVTKMALEVDEALLRAAHALRAGDIELAKTVKKGDSVIDGFQQAIEEAVIETIATQQPVATDLRQLLSVMKIASDLERAGDYAVHLAKATKHFAESPGWRQLEKLEVMAATGSAMIRDTARAYSTRDSFLARATAARDDEIDHTHKNLISDTLIFLGEHPEQATQASKIITVSGYLERLGDHMTNACEAIVFMLEGIRADLND